MDIGEYSVLVMRVDAKPWSINDKTGVSYTLRFMENGMVFRAKLNQDQYEVLKDVVQVQKDIKLKLTAYNETPRLEVVSVA